MMNKDERSSCRKEEPDLLTVCAVCSELENCFSDVPADKMVVLNEDAMRIMAKSREKEVWKAAREEWEEVGCFHEEGSTCEICGKHPLKYRVVMMNEFSNQVMHVGTECAKKYWKVNPNVYAALRDKRLTPAVIERAYEKGTISTKEIDFLLWGERPVWRKTKLTLKQQQWKADIMFRIFRAG